MGNAPDVQHWVAASYEGGGEGFYGGTEVYAFDGGHFNEEGNYEVYPFGNASTLEDSILTLEDGTIIAVSGGVIQRYWPEFGAWSASKIGQASTVEMLNNKLLETGLSSDTFNPYTGWVVN